MLKTYASKAHRTLIALKDVDEDGNLFVVVPAWNPNETILIKSRSIPKAVSEAISKGQTFFHTKVNTGCDSVEELFFDPNSWEVR